MKQKSSTLPRGTPHVENRQFRQKQHSLIPKHIVLRLLTWTGSQKPYMKAHFAQYWVPDVRTKWPIDPSGRNWWCISPWFILPTIEGLHR